MATSDNNDVVPLRIQSASRIYSAAREKLVSKHPPRFQLASGSLQNQRETFYQQPVELNLSNQQQLRWHKEKGVTLRGGGGGEAAARRGPPGR
jgi:hypothetical protein